MSRPVICTGCPCLSHQDDGTVCNLGYKTDYVVAKHNFYESKSCGLEIIRFEGGVFTPPDGAKGLIDIRKCSSCGKDHDLVAYYEISGWVEGREAQESQFFCVCPTTYDSIYLKVL